MQSSPAETGQVAFSPTGTEVWLWTDTSDEINFYAALGNCIYAYDGETSIIYCINCGTGTTVWTATVPIYFDMMYSNDAGTVLCYDEQPYAETTWTESLYSFTNPTVSNATTLLCNITALQDVSFAYFTGVFDDGAALVLNESTNGNGCYNFVCVNSTSCVSVPYYTGYPLFSATPCYCTDSDNDMYGNILFAWSPETETMYALTSAGALIQLNMPFFDWSTVYPQEMINNKQYLGIEYSNAEGYTEGLAMYSIADLNLNEASPPPTPTPPPSPTPTPSPSPTPTSTPTPPLNTTVYSGGAGGPPSQTSSPSTQPSKAPAAGFASLSPLIQGIILTFAIIVVLAVCAATAKNLSQRKIPQGKRRYFFAEVVR
jgi:hypothetical protein